MGGGAPAVGGGLDSDTPVEATVVAGAGTGAGAGAGAMRGDGGRSRSSCGRVAAVSTATVSGGAATS